MDARQVRLDGGEMLHGGADVAEVASLYERVAIGLPGHACHISGEAFHSFADLAGLPVRHIVKRLPAPALNHQAPRPR